MKKWCNLLPSGKHAGWTLGPNLTDFHNFRSAMSLSNVKILNFSCWCIDLILRISVKSLVMLCPPKYTLISLASKPSTQWAAVKIQFSFSNVPPQYNFPKRNNPANQGNSWGDARWPPTIRFPRPRAPQTANHLAMFSSAWNTNK